MKLLGMRVCDHDSNFCYYNNGVVKYHKTERTRGIKHHAIDNLWEWKHEIKSAFNVDHKELDAIAVCFDPWQHSIQDDLENEIAKLIPHFDANCPVWWINHHLSHSLSYDPFLDKPSKISIVIDGYGDWDIAWSVFKGYTLLEHSSVKTDGSIGGGYSGVAEKLGIIGSAHDFAGKLMGLQSFGNLDVDYLNKMKNKKPKDICSEQEWINHHKDIFIAGNTRLDWAKTVHEILRNHIVNIFEKYVNKDDQISYVGGVAQNVCWNTTLKSIYKNLKIFPHCADDGLSIGCLHFLTNLFELPTWKLDNFVYSQSDELGKELSDKTIDRVVDLLVNEKIVGIYCGHGEIGPRALGNRSILMHPGLKGGKDYINQKVKHRENYRPFGATILKEHVGDYFLNGIENPYMLYLDTFKETNHPFESVAHVDNTCRTQTLGDENPTYRKIIERFYDKTGIPMLLNTSLNRGGKPICGNKKDAFGLFYETSLDALVVDNVVYEK